MQINIPEDSLIISQSNITRLFENLSQSVQYINEMHRIDSFNLCCKLKFHACWNRP